MRTKLLLAATLSVLLVTQTGCAASISTIDGAPPPTTTAPADVPLEPPGTSAPPTTPVVPPTSDPSPNPSSDPSSPRPTDTVDVAIDDGSFESVAEMGETASLVVVGDVVEVTSLGRPFADRDPNADEFVAITVRTVDTLKGTPSGELVLPWKAFATDTGGNRTATLITNGIRPPDVADRLLLFLNPADPAFAEVLGGAPTHRLVNLDGIAYLDGDRVVATEVGSPAAEQLLNKSVSEIRDAVGG